MGATQSTPPPPPPPPASAAQLERTLTNAAVDVMTSQLRKIRNEKEHYKAALEDAVQDLDLAQQLMGQQRDEYIFYGVAASVAAAATGGIIAAAIVSRRQTAVVSRISQELADVRRRSALEMAKAEQFGASPLIKSMLPALDAMDAMCAHSKDDEGAKLTREAMHTALRENGVQQVAPSQGDVFDPSTMEAMLTVPVEGTGGNVETILRPGYSLHDRILRAAQVGVGAKNAA
mmetsp:Transcript_28139/g.71995  ORF Transcript_28139/g.71995 Transcript_28139/m.71995 type:complete len:232 (-) Transcript_28139:349-1044(-)